MQAAAFTRKPTSAALRLFALCASRLTAHQSWRRLVCSAFRCAAESVPPSAIGSLPAAFPKRIRLATLHRVSASQVPLTPDAGHSASPMLDKSLVNAYGHYICPVQAARRKTSSCLTVGKPRFARSPAVSLTRYYMVLRYAQKRLRRSRGKDTRTTLPPICGSFHSHFLIQSLPTPTSAYSGRGVFVAMLLTSKGAYQLTTTKQPAQIAQTAFSHYMEYFLFFALST